MVQYDLNKSVLKIRYRDSAVFPPWVPCALSDVVESSCYFENLASFQTNSLVFNLSETFLNFSESLMVFRLCEVEIDSFPNQVRVRGYVGVVHFTTTKGHKTIRKIEDWS